MAPDPRCSAGDQAHAKATAIIILAEYSRRHGSNAKGKFLEETVIPFIVDRRWGRASISVNVEWKLSQGMKDSGRIKR